MVASHALAGKVNGGRPSVSEPGVSVVTDAMTAVSLEPASTAVATHTAAIPDVLNRTGASI
jgi:hypothetical protein